MAISICALSKNAASVDGESLCLYNGELNQSTFPDGAPSFRVPEELVNAIGSKDIQDEDIYISILWKYDNMGELFNIYSLRKYFENSNIDLLLPYIPNARMDRIEDTGDILFLKWFCEIINNLNFGTVYVLDPHSNVSTALLNRVKMLDISNYVNLAYNKIHEEFGITLNALYYPDEGSLKRYGSKYSSDLNIIFGVKTRDFKTGEILRVDIIGQEIDIKGKNILIVDDICSAGGTFYYSAKRLKELGANKIFLYVTHCENTLLKEENISRFDGLIEKVYTTDSILRGKHEKVEVFEL